jgi:DNA-binding transcriptional LysR family regulator
MNLTESMKVFVRVAELASFSAAADQLGLPRASVSAAVRQLETELGTRLLHRTTRRVQMTQDGQVAFERAQDLLADLDELQGLFRARAALLRGRLRVDMPQAIARDVVLPALPAFLAEHPELEIELSSVDRRVDLVREGFDCVLRVGQLADSSLIARPVGAYHMVNCACAGGPARAPTGALRARPRRALRRFRICGCRWPGPLHRHARRPHRQHHSGLRRCRAGQPGHHPGARCRRAPASGGRPPGRNPAHMARCAHARLAGVSEPPAPAAPGAGVHAVVVRPDGAPASMT